jgi:hypothetical protein
MSDTDRMTAHFEEEARELFSGDCRTPLERSEAASLLLSMLRIIEMLAERIDTLEAVSKGGTNG